MAEICCGVVSESKASSPCEARTRAARRRRCEIRRFKCYAGVSPTQNSSTCKRLKTEASTSPSPSPASSSRDCDHASENSDSEVRKQRVELPPAIDRCPKYGVTSVCGRRRDMEDAVSIQPSFFRREGEAQTNLHFFGVYDGHGCSHVAMSCKEKLHEILAEELGNRVASEEEWKDAMNRSFLRMDREVATNGRDSTRATNCRCELQTPQCDAVGSTAVVAVVSRDEIVVANCGDSRAVLCRNGKPIALSSDHKPDRADEQMRIEEAGGRVIYWDGPRVLGVLAMSRAIGDNYLKPYVICEPEVTVTARSVGEEEFLILGSDGLWDVVSNAMACDIVRMCLGSGGRGGKKGGSAPAAAAAEENEKACSDAAMLLTKVALARQSSDNVSVVVVDLRAHHHS